MCLFVSQRCGVSKRKVKRNAVCPGSVHNSGEGGVEIPRHSDPNQSLI